MALPRVIREYSVIIGLGVLILAYLGLLAYGAITGAPTRTGEDLIIGTVVLIWGGQLLTREPPASLKGITGGIFVVAGVLHVGVAVLSFDTEATAIPQLVLLGGLLLYLYAELLH